MFTHFHMPTRIVFGAGSLSRISEEIPSKRLLIVCGGTARRQGLLERIAAHRESGSTEIFDAVEPNPSCETVERAAALARAWRPDCVLGLGGGSPLDVAKAVACLVTHEGAIGDYLDGRLFSAPRPYLAAIPTTAGTGSEVTPFAAFTDTRARRKRLLRAPLLQPDLALVDPELTLTVPPRVTAATGLDSLCHAMEAFWSVNAQPVTDACALRAIALILDNLPRAWEQGRDIAARTGMAQGSLLAGVAFSQTMTNACHAMSYALTARHGVDHGFACALTLPAVTRRMAAALPDKFAWLLRALDIPSAEALVARLTGLMRRIQAPTCLAEAGVGGDHAEALCEAALAAPNIRLAPCVFTRDDVLAALCGAEQTRQTGKET